MTAGGPAAPGAAEQGKKAFLGRTTPGKPFLLPGLLFGLGKGIIEATAGRDAPAAFPR